MAIIQTFPSLTVLISAVIAGDEVAQWQLQGLYDKGLQRFLRGYLAVNRCLWPYEDGEEIANFVWLKALNVNNLKNLRDPCSFPGWLHVIATNDANAHLPNCLKRRPTYLEDCDPSTLSNAQIVPGDRALEAQELLATTLELAKSDRDHRVYPILCLRALGYAYAEIATRLGISEELMRTIHGRGLMRIKAILGQQNYKKDE